MATCRFSHDPLRKNSQKVQNSQKINIFRASKLARINYPPKRMTSQTSRS